MLENISASSCGISLLSVMYRHEPKENMDGDQPKIFLYTSQRPKLAQIGNSCKKRLISYLQRHCNQIKCFLNIGISWDKQARHKGIICSIVLSITAVNNVKNTLKRLAHWMAHIKYCIIFRNSVRKMSATDSSRIIY